MFMKEYIQHCCDFFPLSGMGSTGKSRAREGTGFERRADEVK